MSILDYIRELQGKPEHVRRRILWITTIALTLVFVGVWVTTLPSRLSLPASRGESVRLQRPPLSSLKENISSFLKSADFGFSSPNQEPVLPESSVSPFVNIGGGEGSEDATTWTPAP